MQDGRNKIGGEKKTYVPRRVAVLEFCLGVPWHLALQKRGKDDEKFQNFVLKEDDMFDVLMFENFV